jgi:hypothetical protein
MSSFNKLLTFLGLCACQAAAAPLEFRTRELPRAVFGAAYHAGVDTQVDGRCPNSDVILELSAGNLPRGIDLSGNALTGIPREFGVFRVRIRAANLCVSASQDLTLEVTGKPILRVTPEQLVIEYREGDPLPSAEALLVSASWPELAYSVTAGNAPWLRWRANQGVTPYQGSAYAADAVVIQVVPEGLAPGVYRGVLSFSADLAANMPQISVTLRVLAKSNP